jgi:gliding motility-associated-like protein
MPYETKNFFLLLFILISVAAMGQKTKKPSSQKAKIVFASSNDNDPFGTRNQFIANIGQYGDSIRSSAEMGRVLFGYEGMDMPVLFTAKGMIHLQRKEFGPSRQQIERLEKAGHSEEEIGKFSKRVDRIITMEWIGANKNPRMVTERSAGAYHTYGLLPGKAYSFTKVTFKEIYPGIDLEYSINHEKKNGFFYKLIVHAGGALSRVAMRYGGDVRTITSVKDGTIKALSDINGVLASFSVTDSNSQALRKSSSVTNFSVRTVIENRVQRYSVPNGSSILDGTAILYFISSTSALTGVLHGEATDVDYDFAGNVFVSGGGDLQSGRIAKYNASGQLQWVFSGTLTEPNWIYGKDWGGWAVDKASGSVYVGQGLTTGSRIVRLNSSGVYDNYISDTSFLVPENWKMLWKNNNGLSQIIVGGGGEVSSNDLVMYSPPSTTPTVVNLSGKTDQTNQDISDMVLDPQTFQLYCLFCCHLDGYLNGSIKKFDYPYSSPTTVWSNRQLPPALVERKNRPNLFVPGAGTDETGTSTNILAVNDTHIFLWDGSVLKAHDKITGSMQSFVTIDPYFLITGGIHADNCNNVYLGMAGQRIKVVSYNGVNFDDDAQPDIEFPELSFLTFDMAFDTVHQRLYCCGNNMVCSIDISGYASGGPAYALSVDVNCATKAATVNILPGLPSGIIPQYNLYQGSDLIASNSEGIFANLNPDADYSISLSNKIMCGAPHPISFKLPHLTVSLSNTKDCLTSSGSITVTTSGGQEPYYYSLDGISFQSSNFFTGLSAGAYNVISKDANGCTGSNTAVIGSCLNAVLSSSDALCSNNNGKLVVEVTTGTRPYLYSLDGIQFQSDSTFSNLSAGNYTVTIKDASGSTTTVTGSIKEVNKLQITTTTVDAICGGPNGSILISTSQGTPPLKFSLDGIHYQMDSLFNHLLPGPYILSVKDNNGCSRTESVNISSVSSLQVEAGSNKTICEGQSVRLNASSNGDQFVWSPSSSLDNATTLTPVASPSTTTKYYLNAFSASCKATDSMIVNVNPAPVADAGVDQTICYGQGFQLVGKGGVTYTWRPATNLSSDHIANPSSISYPLNSVFYSLTVTDGQGCSSLHADTVHIIVLQAVHLFAGNDTTVFTNQLFSLHASEINGPPVVSYSWLPVQGLSNPAVSNPVVSVSGDITYTVTGYTASGCYGSDTVNIKVISRADIFVPTAFTPNHDGKNDVLRAIPIGVKELVYFKVFNRWGELIFSTVDAQKGWDGTIAGTLQKADVFVWEARAIDANGKMIEKRGSTLLIR